MRSLVLTEAVTFNIEGQPHVVTLAIEHTEHKHSKHYWIDAIAETGFDLCNPSYGYLKNSIERNTRLRSEASIVADMYSVLEAYIKAIQAMENDIVLTSRKVNGRIDYTTFYGDQSHWVIMEACNLNSTQSRQGIAWHSHDVYKQGNIAVTVLRNADGQLRYYADERDLYDLDKLRVLRSGERFQSQGYAFFSYNEVLRLLGETHGNIKELSGLLPKGESLL